MSGLEQQATVCRTQFGTTLLCGSDWSDPSTLSAAAVCNVQEAAQVPCQAVCSILWPIGRPDE